MCQWSPADGPRQQSLLRVISEVLAGPPQEPRLTGSVGGRGQEEGLGVRWQGANLLQVSQLELPADWQRVGQRCLPDQLLRGKSMTDFNER